MAGGLHPDNKTKPRPSCPLEGGRGAQRGCRHQVTSGRGEEGCHQPGAGGCKAVRNLGRAPKGRSRSAQSLEDGAAAVTFKKSFPSLPHLTRAATPLTRNLGGPRYTPRGPHWPVLFRLPLKSTGGAEFDHVTRLQCPPQSKLPSSLSPKLHTVTLSCVAIAWSWVLFQNK